LSEKFSNMFWIIGDESEYFNTRGVYILT